MEVGLIKTYLVRLAISFSRLIESLTNNGSVELKFLVGRSAKQVALYYFIEDACIHRIVLFNAIILLYEEE